MKFLFRILKNAFVQHLAAEGLSVINTTFLEALKANQKRKPGAKAQIKKALDRQNRMVEDPAAHGEAINTITEVKKNG